MSGRTTKVTYYVPYLQPTPRSIKCAGR